MSILLHVLSEMSLHSPLEQEFGHLDEGLVTFGDFGEEALQMGSEVDILAQKRFYVSEKVLRNCASPLHFWKVCRYSSVSSL